MRVEELETRFPRLYHMAEAGSWSSIARCGLLSTSALLDLYGVTGRQRTAIESGHRPENVVLTSETHGSAVIRDQKPLNMVRLAGCLTDMTTIQWLEHLNCRVFFWTSETRLQRLLCAKPYRELEHDVLIVETAPLIARHSDQVTLAPYNTGATMPTAVPRGSATFRAIADYPYDEWRRKRPAWDAVVEVAVQHGVPHVRKFVSRVERRRGSAIVDVIWAP
jgi:hypothetical protein